MPRSPYRIFEQDVVLGHKDLKVNTPTTQVLADTAKTLQALGYALVLRYDSDEELLISSAIPQQIDP